MGGLYRRGEVGASRIIHEHFCCNRDSYHSEATCERVLSVRTGVMNNRQNGTEYVRTTPASCCIDCNDSTGFL